MAPNGALDSAVLENAKQLVNELTRLGHCWHDAGIIHVHPTVLHRVRRRVLCERAREKIRSCQISNQEAETDWLPVKVWRRIDLGTGDARRPSRLAVYSPYKMVALR